MDLDLDGRMELLERLRWTEMKAGKCYTRSEESAKDPGSRIPQDDRKMNLVPGLLSMLDADYIETTN